MRAQTHSEALRSAMVVLCSPAEIVLSPQICLSMIVKNESAVIARCLQSVRPLIQRWVIVDTGSGDGTQDIIRRTMADVPGELHERPWRDFASNRNEALALAASQSGFVFVIDADETLEWPESYQLPALHADAYSLVMAFDQMRYRRTCLLKASAGWRYEGVLHEYLVAPDATTVERLDGPQVRVRAEGARSQNPRKFQDDAALLERALAVAPDNARYRFYLAQSYRDAGEVALALAHYRRRVALLGWDEERWYAQYQCALLLEQMENDSTSVQQAYLEAFRMRPTRNEPLTALARYWRLRGEYALALLYARSAEKITMPADDMLFVDLSSYQWRALDELAVSAWWAGAHHEGAAAVAKLLAESLFPDSERHRIEANAGFYRDAGHFKHPA